MGVITNIWGKASIAVCASIAMTACDARLPAADPDQAAVHTPTIVSLNPCIDAILVEIAAPGQVLALSHYSRDPSSSSIDPDVAENFAFTGGTAEEIIALSPDIVLASTFIAPATRSALERAGLRVETFGSPVSIDESLIQVGDVATLVGRGDQGADLAAQISAALPPAQSPPETGAVRAMLWQPGQIVPGDASLVWDILDRYGVVNHSAALGLGQADHASLEMIMADPPHLLLIAGDQPGQLHPVLQQLDATFTARFEPKLFYCGGPSISAAVARMDAIKAEFMMKPPGEFVRDAR